MKVIGLTGGIGMGKSTITRWLRRWGVPVHEADKAVHRLLQGRARAPIMQAFPQLAADPALDRQKLGQQVFADRKKLKKLEKILHPLVRAETLKWLQRQQRKGTRIVCLDIPLLFETNAPYDFTQIWTASCPPAVQSQRVLARTGMSAAKLARIRARQWPDTRRRQRSDVVINTALPLPQTRDQVKQALEALAAQRTSQR